MSSTTAAAAAMRTRRLRVRIEGTVQGVGFRPFVHRLATELGLAGWVHNDSAGVVAEVEGAAESLERFLTAVRCDAPPLAVIERVAPQDRPPAGERGFTIRESAPGRERAALLSPDVATCEDCLGELHDPGDRRYRHAFISCTSCGPRFTIVRGVPYDRSRTTMDPFPMCPRCQAEYQDPHDRRFHAQANACWDCGPRAVLRDGSGVDVTDGGARDAVAAAATALLDGAVVAVKGLGGYHLACLADDERVLRRLRAKKHREDKPFAVMVEDLAAARRLAVLDRTEEELLRSPRRPILLARRRAGGAVAPSVAPGHRDLGLVLAYTPLHHVLLADIGRPLVMTSGNASGEPIACREDEALERLHGIADLFLMHDRAIETRTDDSVVRVVSVGGARRPLVLRRSRGWVPAPSPLPVEASHPILATGGHLKNTFALAQGRRVWLGPHVGDLESPEALRSFEEGIDHLARLLDVRARVVAHDLHPEYLCTKHALERVERGGAGDSGTPAPAALGVQHHHAHLAACLAEHGETGPALGVIFDGTGHGTDGTVWGGELLLGGLAGSRRVGHLWPVRLPGGEAAVRQPWRMACAWLTTVSGGVPSLPATLSGQLDPTRWERVAKLALRGIASPVTTSMGRLFDAVSALCGINLEATYEGQAASELESAADGASSTDRGYPMPLVEREDGLLVLDARETIRAVLTDLDVGEPRSLIAARFHEGVAAATAQACRLLAERHDVGVVALSGGVFQNRLLLERTAELLARMGLRPLVPERHPPNDGGLAYGQAACAAARMVCRAHGNGCAGRPEGGPASARNLPA